MKDSVINNIKELIKDADIKNIVASNIKVEDVAESNTIIEINLIISTDKTIKVKKLNKNTADYYS